MAVLCKPPLCRLGMGRMFRRANKRCCIAPGATARRGMGAILKILKRKVWRRKTRKTCSIYLSNFAREELEASDVLVGDMANLAWDTAGQLCGHYGHGRCGDDEIRVRHPQALAIH